MSQNQKQEGLDRDASDFEVSGFHLRNENYMSLRHLVGAQ